MRWENQSQEEYLQDLRKAPKDYMFALIGNDIRQSAANMLNLAALIKGMNDDNIVLTREKLCEDDELIEILKFLLEAVLINCPNIVKVINAASQRFEDEGT